MRGISKTKIKGLPLDLNDWKFGLDLAATHIFGWNPSADLIPLWTMSFSNHSEELSTLSHTELLPGGHWLGPHTVQSLFGRLGLVQASKNGTFLFVIMEGGSVWLQQIVGDPEMRGHRVDRFTLRLPRGDFHPIVLYSPGRQANCWSWSPSKKWTAENHRVPWIGPLTQAKRRYSPSTAPPPFFEEKNCQGYDHLVSPGGHVEVIFHSANLWPVSLGSCLGLTRFGGAICRGEAPTEFLLANYGKEGGLEKTTVEMPGSLGEEILLVMEDAWGRLNFITQFDGDLYLAEWCP